MPFLNFSADIMIFTDQSRTAGGITGTGDAGTAVMVTGKLLRMFEEVYFSETQVKTAHLNALVAAPSLALNLAEQPQIVVKLAEMADRIPGLTMGTESQNLGPITTVDFNEVGFLNLNGINQWRPPGRLMSRQSGQFTVHFVVSPMDLRGRVRSPDIIASAQLVPTGVQLVASDSGCGACGACGACGLCTICGGLNVAVAGAASAALIAVIAIRGMSFDPEERFDLMARGVLPSRELLDATERLYSLLDFIP